MIANPVMRDERTESVENASYRWAYLLLSYGLLMCVMYRAFVIHETSWDLIMLVIVGGGVASLYQASQQVLNQKWRIMTIAAVVIAVLVGAVIAVAH